MTNAMTLPNTGHSSPAKAASAGALTFAQSSLLTGQIGNIDAYIQAVNRIPMLTPSEERQFATEFREQRQPGRRAPASCCRTCGWWCRSPATIWVTACRTPT